MMNERYSVLAAVMTLSLGAAATTNYMAAALSPYAGSGALPGAVSVLVSGEREEIACLGYADYATKRPITLDSTFMQCSQTKGFCGVTMAKLIEEGKVGLDDPVAKYLPEFQRLWVKASETNGVMTLKEAEHALTIRMCLNHTGGFPFECSAKNPAIRGGGWSGGAPIRQVAAIAAASPLLFEPGTSCQYSNTGIDIAAAVIETVTGMRWEDYLQASVLDPLGMKDTTFWPTAEQLSRQIEFYELVPGGEPVYVYERDWQQRPYNGRHVFASAGAGLWTTVRDQLRFYRMLMNLGLGDNGVRILREETVRKYLAASTRAPELMAKFGGYSMGLAVTGEGTEDSWFGHGGAWGTNCMVNYRRKELKLWVWQYCGGQAGWGAEKDAAEKAFFAEELANASADEYTGRTE